MKEINIQDILNKTSDLNQEKLVGYVAIIGRPNAGKSTFINTLIGEKISITTNTPQTTRKRVLAIHNDEDSQIIFFDTPGIHKSEKEFNKKINDVAIHSFKDCEVILYFIDATRDGWEEEKYIREMLDMVNKPVIKIYTKADLPSKISIPQWDHVIHISSVSKQWFDSLLQKVKKYLKNSPLLFPTDVYTKQDIYFRISEIIREKAFLHTKEELPHSLYVWVEEVQDEEDILKMVGYIYTETDSQKYILIGKWWKLVQQIWTESREELEKIFWKKVFLALRVKVKKNWRKDGKLVKNILG